MKSRCLRTFRLAMIGVSIAAGACFEASARGDGGESWDAVYIKGVKVGYTHLFVTPLKNEGRDLLRIQFEQVMALRRDHDQSTTKIRYGTIETPTGEVLRLDTLLSIGKEVIRVHGDVIDGRMNLILESNGRKQEQSVDWSPEVRGPYAVELSLARTPIKPGETRSLKAFVPILNKIVTLEVYARDLESVTLGDGEIKKLLRVDTEGKNADGTRFRQLDATFWVDSGGQILKSYTDEEGGMTMYRTTAAAAKALPKPSERLNIIATSILKVAPIEDSIKTRDIVYEVTVRGEDPAKLFPSDFRQTVVSAGDGKTATIHVKSTGPDDGDPGPEKVDSKYIKANPLIDSSNLLVRRYARTAIGIRNDPWDQAQAIERWVSDNIKDKNFETAFASASEVARDLSGDCTEHSVLAAAMSRSVGIPSRVACGLVYSPEQKGFGFHMWHEVYVNQRWVALDSTYNQTSVDATHIKLFESDLAGVSPFEAFLPVAAVFDKATLKVVEIRR